MAEETQEAKSLKDRLPDILGILGSVVVLLLAVLVFTNKVPRIYQWFFPIFTFLRLLVFSVFSAKKSR